MSDIPLSTVVGAAAFVAGMVFGATAQRTNFCTMGAISDMVLMGDWRRFRAWMLAVSVGILASQSLHAAGLINLGKSIYLAGAIGWGGAILGGVMFGFGMTMAGGCGNKTLVRIGGGNLKSLVVFLVVGLFAYATLRGLLALGRVQVEQAASLSLAGTGIANQGLPAILAAVGLGPMAARWLPVLLTAGVLAAWCLKDAEFRASPRDVLGGVIIGLMVPAGWAVTGILGNDEFEPVALASFTFVAPIGESMQYLMTFTGATISFGVAAVGGVIAGAFVASVSSKSFHWEGFAGTDDMARHLVGAALMGVGGVMAMGCTIGQGLTGLSTLSLTSIIATLAILFGGVWGMKTLEEGSLLAGLRAALPWR